MSALKPRSIGGRVLLVLVALFLLFAIVSAASWLYYVLNPVSVVEPPPTPVKMLMRPIAAGPQQALLHRGRYLTIAGDCVSCHTRADGRPFEGGLGLKTPFGVIYSPNLTGSQAGIGGWTAEQFHTALTRGIAPGGRRLYPALPYNHFDVLSRPDTDAILAYLKTVPGSGYTAPAPAMPFPFNFRPVMIAWNWLFFHPEGFRGDPAHSREWNRGAQLVQGLGHCGACHTPKNFAGADDTNREFHGGMLDNWVAPDLTANTRTGLGAWSAADIAEYLKTGRSAHSNAAGSMAQVVSYSTSLMSDPDLAAIATYLKSLPASPSPDIPAADTAAMRAGAAIYADACTACHRVGGKGSPGLFPPLAGSAATQQGDAASVIHLILAGGRTGPTPTRPSTQSMPSFAWKLDDQQIADVATYVRNAWGNRAPGVSKGQVADMRKSLALRKPLAAP